MLRRPHARLERPREKEVERERGWGWGKRSEW